MAECYDLAYYKRLPYTRRVEIRDEPGGAYFLARIGEIPFIRAEGATQEDALYNLAQLFEDCIEAMIENGDMIPEPPTVFPAGPVAVQERLPIAPVARGDYRTEPEDLFSTLPSGLQLVGA